MYKALLVVFFLAISTKHYSQDYTNYYQLIQRAKIAESLDKLASADSLYALAFKGALGFTDDYSSALLNRFRLTQTIDEELLCKTIETGSPWMDIKGDLRRMGVSRYVAYKKLYRKHRHRKAVNGFPIFCLIVRDILSRSKNLRFLASKHTDSINAVKLHRLFVKKPDLFDRTKAGWLSAQFLEILLIHQDDWNNAAKIFYQVREHVKQGKIAPVTIQSMVERASLFRGTAFNVDTLTGELRVMLAANKPICGQTYYTAIYGAYARFYDKERKKMLLCPSSPVSTKAEINALRNQLFLLDVEEAFSPDKFVFLSEEEYCKRFRFK